MEADLHTTNLNSDMTNCSICSSTWTDPMCFPGCNHIICSKCLKNLDEPRGSTKCPICRLKKIFIHQKLLYSSQDLSLSAQKTNKKELVYSSTLCELCNDSISTEHCINCEQNMCSQCAPIHLDARVARSHKIVHISKKEGTPKFGKQYTSCFQHEDETIRLYCEECQMPLCFICSVLKEHRGHTFSALKQAYKMFTDKIRACHGDVNEGISETKCRIEQLGNEIGEFKNIISVEYKSLQETKEKLKEIIETEHKQLLQNLDHIEEKRLKDMSTKVDELKLGVQVLEDFINKSQKLIDEGSECEVCCSANVLITEADALLQAQALANQKIICCDVSFTPAIVPVVNASGYKLQLVGKIYCSNTSYLDSELLSDQDGEPINVNELFSEVSDQKERVFKQLEKNFTSFLCHPSVVQVTPGKGGICGVAVTGNKVFVARDGMTCIEVYGSNNLTLIEKLEVSKSRRGLSNPRLAACSKNNCLYIGSSSDVRRFDLTCSETNKWKTVKGDCTGLSVTSNYNLLVTLRDSRKVQEHNTDGDLIREIILDRSIDDPLHCIQISNGSFAVSTFALLKARHQVCLLRPNGQAEVFYGGSKESGVIQLKRPLQLAVDKHDHVFVIDHDNNRIQLLDQTLTHIGNIQTPGIQIKEPHTICLDETNHRLHIGEWTGRLLTVQANISF